MDNNIYDFIKEFVIDCLIDGETEHNILARIKAMTKLAIQEERKKEELEEAYDLD